MTSSDAVGEARVFVGVDTHRDEHVAVAIDHLGGRLGDHRVTTTSVGYEGLDCWAMGLGEVVAFGIEGTGSYGAGLARYLAGRGRTVIEVSRPDRSTRRRLGKSDPIDAEMAARAVLAGVAKDSPKSGLDKVEMIRMLKIVKDSAIKARTQAINQMKALIVTARWSWPSTNTFSLASPDNGLTWSASVAASAPEGPAKPRLRPTGV